MRWAEVEQTRGLLIDLVAQTGHYPPNATDLSQFIVEGENATGFTSPSIPRLRGGTIAGKQLEEVLE